MVTMHRFDRALEDGMPYEVMVESDDRLINRGGEMVAHASLRFEGAWYYVGKNTSPTVVEELVEAADRKAAAIREERTRLLQERTDALKAWHEKQRPEYGLHIDSSDWK